MKSYLFALWYTVNGHNDVDCHEENFACNADAMIRARKILEEGKRDCNAFMISLYEKNGLDWRNIVNYQ